MVRLLYVIDSLAPGGAETSLAAMAPALIDLGIDLHVFPLGQALDLAAPLEAAGARVYTRTGGSGRLANVAAVRNLAETLRPDLIHTTLFEADIAGRTAAWVSGIPSSTSLVSESYGSVHTREANRLKLRAAREVDALTAVPARRIHAVSRAVADSVGPALRLPAAKIEVIPRGRDPRVFPFQPTGVRAEVRAELGIPADAPVVLAVGRLEPAKGLQHLVAALPQIAAVNPNVVVLVAGRNGRSADSLKRESASLQVPVRFLGHRTDVPRLMASADVLAFPSEREGSPGTLIEAMAVGIPIVASDIAPNLEVLGDTDACGRCVPVGAASPLADAIVDVLIDPVQASSRALSARSRFEDQFTVKAVADRMLAFFGRAAGVT